MSNICSLPGCGHEGDWPIRNNVPELFHHHAAMVMVCNEHKYLEYAGPPQGRSTSFTANLENAAKADEAFGETIICTHANRMHFQPWELSDDDPDPYGIEETTRLQRELFCSDPVLREHVGRCVDINPKLFMTEKHAARFKKGLERAWELAWGGPTQTVESEALARACDRCAIIMDMDEEE